jgi:hypothetical protein
MTDDKPVTPAEPTPANTDEVVFTEPVTPETDAEPVTAEPVTVATVDEVSDPVVDEEPPALVEPPASVAEPIVDAPVYDEPVETVEAPAETADIDNTAVLVPEGVVAAAPVAQTVYVAAPVPPRYRGNRGFGVLIAIIATVIFAAVLAVVLAIIDAAKGLAFSFDFVTQPDFYFPVAFFLVGFVVLVLIVNRGSWWAYILGSIFVALFVYFGFVGAELLNHSVFGMTPSEAGRATAALLGNPTVIAAALIAREVSMWTGSAISARGRRVKARNIEARRAHEAELEARRNEYGNAA